MLGAWHATHPGHAGKEANQVPTAVGDVTRDQAFRVLKDDYYDRFGLADVDDELLAHQLADMYVNHGFGNATSIVQGAIDQVMRNNRSYTQRRLPLLPNDPIGPRTRARLNWLVESGHGPELRNALVDRRQQFAANSRRLSDVADQLIGRAGRFREWRHPPIFGDQD